MFDYNLRVLRDDEVDVVFFRCRLLRFALRHVAPHRSARRDLTSGHKIRDARHKAGHAAQTVVYFNACNASYWACDQPAPALASLCSGRAALRKASRSTSTTVFPSLRNSSASLSSEARIWSVDFALASCSTWPNTFLSASETFDQSC